MISIRYPGMPQGVDAGSIIDAFNLSHDRAEQQRNEAQAKSVLERYANSLYGGGGQPQTLGGLQGMFQPAAPAGTVTRAPLPGVADYPSQRVAQAFGGPGAPAVAAQGSNITSNGIAGRFLKTVRDGGVTNPYALAAIAATGKAESGFDPKNATRVWSDPSQSGQAGSAGGIMSWRNDRLRNLQQFAQQNGDDPSAPSPETQAKFLLAEDPSLIQKLQNAGSAQEAQQLMNNAWRFAGYDQPGGEAGRRFESANAYAAQFGGSPSQDALEGLAVGGSAPMGAPSAPAGVQVADASGGMRAMPGQADTSSLLPPREDMAAMFANPVTRPLAAQLAQSVIKMRAGQADPQTQLEYQIAVEKLRQLRSGTPNANSSFGNLDAQARAAGLIPGTPDYQQFMLNGGGAPATFRSLDMQAKAAGFQPGTPEYNEFMATRGAGLSAGASQTAKNQADIATGGDAARTKAQGQAEGKAAGEASANLPQVETNAASILGAIDSLANDPYLDSMLGPVNSRKPNLSADSERVQSKMNQIGGQSFLQAFNMLRGGGQITEVEGQKATEAMARLNTAQSPKDYREALGELRDIVQRGVDKARRQAGGGGSAAPTGNRTSSGVQWSIEE